jgi:hypothetical protein
MARLFPKVTFGLGAAVLAGVMVVLVPAEAHPNVPAGGHVITTIALDAVINAAAGIAAYETTCCAIRK